MKVSRVVLTVAAVMLMFNLIGVRPAQAEQRYSARIWVTDGYLKFAGGCEYTTRQRMNIYVYIQKKRPWENSSHYKTIASYPFVIGWVDANYGIGRMGTGPKISKTDNATNSYRAKTSCMYYVTNPYDGGSWVLAGNAYTFGI